MRISWHTLDWCQAGHHPVEDCEPAKLPAGFYLVNEVSMMTVTSNSLTLHNSIWWAGRKIWRWARGLIVLYALDCKRERGPFVNSERMGSAQIWWHTAEVHLHSHSSFKTTSLQDLGAVGRHHSTGSVQWLNYSPQITWHLDINEKVFLKSYRLRSSKPNFVIKLWIGQTWKCLTLFYHWVLGELLKSGFRTGKS